MPAPLRVLVAAAAVSLLGTASASAQDPSQAPATTLGNGGRSVSDGVRSLSASQTADLDPAGQTVTIRVQGFDVNKGYYVAFCLIPPVNQPPTPCGGGRADQTGAVGASFWLRGDDYGRQNSATPLNPDGSYEGQMTLNPQINDAIDCRQARCAIVTRMDHKATTDRSADLILPVTFGAPRAGGGSSTTVAPAPTVPTTLPALQPTQVAPTATVDADGTSVSDGTRTLRATAVEDLDPERAAVTVEGSGFDVTRGVFVSLCAVPAADPSLPAGAAPKPAPCAGGSADVSRWVSSNPPDYGRDRAVPYGDGGSFEADLVLAAVIDAGHDCREVECAIVVRNDDTNPDDRTQDLYLPVRFAAASTAVEDEPEGDATVTETGDDGGSSNAGLLLAGLGGVVVVAGIVGALVARRRAAGPGPDAEPPVEVAP